MEARADQTLKLTRAALVLAFAWALLRTAWLSDDAFITFRVVENAIEGLGLRWNAAERVQVSTHPLWLLLHVPLRALTGEIYFTSLAVSALLTGVALAVLCWQPRIGAAGGVVLLAGAVSSKAFVDYSTSGLENPLTHVLLAAFVAFWWRAEGRPADHLPKLCVLGGLLAFDRLDSVLLVAPALGVAAWSATPTLRLALRCASAFAPLAVWLIFATLYYGAPFPNTALAKLGGGESLPERAAMGWRYLAASWRWDPVTVVCLAAAVAVAWTIRRHRALLAGAMVYVLYLFWIGGDFMSGRFLTAPLLLALSVLGAEAPRLPVARVLAVALGILVLGLLPPGAPLRAGPDYGRGAGPFVDRWGIADERAMYFQGSGLWNDTAPRLPRDAQWLEARAARSCEFPVMLGGAVGFYGYAAGPGVHVVDYNALADPLLARLPPAREDRLYLSWLQRTIGEDAATSRRVGHLYRNVPPGYLASQRGDDARFDDPRVKELAQTVRKLVRDPVFSRGRLAASAELLRHDAGALESAATREFNEPPVAELLALAPDSSLTSMATGCALVASDPAGALDPLRRAVAACGDNGPAWRCLAAAARQAGATGEALRAHSELLRLAPEAGWVHLELAQTLGSAGRTAEAVEALERALLLDPGLDPARELLERFGAPSEGR